MRFDISRQPLVPAFLTLLLLAAVAMGSMETTPSDRIIGSPERALHEAAQAEGTTAQQAPGLEYAARTAAPQTGATTKNSAGRQTPAQESAARTAAPQTGATAENPAGRQTPAQESSGHTAAPEAGVSATAEQSEGHVLAAETDATAENPAERGSDAHGTAGQQAARPQTAAYPAPAPQPAVTRNPAFGTALPEAAAREMAGGESIGTANRTLLLPLPAAVLLRFQAAFPGWARWAAGFLILFTALCVGRMTVRHNLYAVGTCIAIPLCGALLCALSSGDETLPALAAAALLALSVKNFSRSFCNGYAFDPLFRASLYTGMLLLLLPQALPLLLLPPLAVVLFRRTLRETTVALFGVLLPILLFCYINWGAGGTFTAFFVQVGAAWHGGHFGTLFSALPLPALIVLGGIALLVVWAVLLFSTDIYFVGTKSRIILLFNIGALLLAAAGLFSPAATAAASAPVAVPAAVLMPLLFVRIRRFIALPLYLSLLAAAVAAAVLQ